MKISHEQGVNAVPVARDAAYHLTNVSIRVSEESVMLRRYCRACARPPAQGPGVLWYLPLNESFFQEAPKAVVCVASPFPGLCGDTACGDLC
jgi:hypothetical protein